MEHIAQYITAILQINEISLIFWIVHKVYIPFWIQENVNMMNINLLNKIYGRQT